MQIEAEEELWIELRAEYNIWVTAFEPGFERQITRSWWYPKPPTWILVGASGLVSFQFKKVIKSFEKPHCNPDDMTQAQGSQIFKIESKKKFLTL